LKANIGISREQNIQGKRFILSWKVRENEFCKVVGTMSEIVDLQ